MYVIFPISCTNYQSADVSLCRLVLIVTRLITCILDYHVVSANSHIANELSPFEILELVFRNAVHRAFRQFLEGLAHHILYSVNLGVEKSKY